jgi:hypothetical protein
VLGLARLADGAFTLCANDRTIAGRLSLTLEQLRAEVLVELGDEDLELVELGAEDLELAAV